MITEKQKQIIRLLLNNKEGYNVNQVARILGISVSWVHETLRTLEREEILVSNKIANSILFKINWNNLKAEKICDFVILDDYSRNKVVVKIQDLSTQTSEVTKEKGITRKELVQENKTNYVVENISNENKIAYSTIISSSGYVAPQGLSRPGNIDGPYKQANAMQTITPVGYSVASVGESGVNNVLFSYATSGAFNYGGNSIYSSTQNYYGRGIAVPPDTLGSKLSNNVSNFTITQHTSSHLMASAPGCKYCGPEPKI